jgi:hypothetical protein
VIIDISPPAGFGVSYENAFQLSSNKIKFYFTYAVQTADMEKLQTTTA